MPQQLIIVEVTTKHQNHISVVRNKQSEQHKWVYFRQIKKMRKAGDLVVNAKTQQYKISN